ncbi:hypothetical protein FHX75_121054 [Micromonospora palomenae]|uniref:PH (Pleckstrin Homology) domain-containing protein n=1 Tax=Micromonospora palomenae TaxID=1461247 RepID=A0A561WF84_9ACTN|nr:hypothetical protein FHX75_121054 [Micromonospora palomenae]
MRLRRDTAKVRRNYLFVAFLGAGGWGAARYSEADPNSVFTSTGPLKYLAAALFIVAACALASLLWPFVIHVHDDGMTLRSHGVTTRLPWGSVEMLTAAKRGTGWTDPMLQIRVAPGVRIKGRIGSDHDGRRVYNLLPLEDFTLPPEQVVAILREHSGGKVEAQDYLNYRAGKRAVARWLTEEHSEDSNG